MRGCELEQLPVIPLIGAHSAVIAGRDPREAFLNGEVMGELQVKAVELYEPDGAFHYMDLTVEAEALGAEIGFRGGAPVVVNHAIPEGFEFSVERGRIGVYARATRILAEELGSRFFIGAYVTGPLTLALELVGAKPVTRWLVKGTGSISDLLLKISEFVIEYAKLLVESGADCVMVLEPSCTLASPRAFSRVMPLVDRVCRAVSSMDAYPILHICGDAGHLLRLLPNIEASAYHLDSKVSLREARRVVGSKCLMGNIDTRLLLTGSEGDVVRAVRRCVGEMGSKLYIVSAGCEVPPQTPPENLNALIRAVKLSH